MTRSVFRLTLPILFGYIPLGMAFGVLFATQLDYPWWVAPLTGLIIYAGAGQILAVSLLAGHAGLGWRKAYLIFGLTDETYSLLTSRPQGNDRAKEQDIDFRITALNQCYWIVGCALGALLANNLTFDSSGIEFALVALFIVLTIEQYKALGDSFPIWTGAAGAALAILFLEPAHQLIGAIVIVTGVLLIQYRKLRTEVAGEKI